MEPSVKGELEICLNGHTSTTKKAAIPLDVENHLKLFFRTKKAFKLSLILEQCAGKSNHCVNPRLITHGVGWDGVGGVL